jgi:hypothetical protein
MFRLMMLAAWTVLHAYVFGRAAGVPGIARRFPPKRIWLAGGISWLSFFFTMALGRRIPWGVCGVMERIGMDWLAILFLTATCLFIMDVFTLGGLIFRKRAPALRGWALLAGSVLSAAAMVQGLRPPVIVDYEVRLKDLPKEWDGTVLVALSDLHLGNLLGQRWLGARVAQVREMKPDIIVLLGDIMEGHGGQPQDYLGKFREMSAPLGVWGVSGNHETHGTRIPSVRLLEGAGIGVLHDRWVEIRPGLVLVGVDDLTHAQRSGLDGGPIAAAFAGRPAGAAILLSHTPWKAEEAAAAGAGLMLSGHTHGGQIWPFGYIVRLTYPLLAGRYEVKDMPVIVSRGTGTWGPRMRLWAPGEITRVTLRAPTDVRPPAR